MKLSEAIRLGAMLKPQAFGALSSTDQTGTCAMGAAIQAIGSPMRALRDGEASTNGRRSTGTPLVADVPQDWQNTYDAKDPVCPECAGIKVNVLAAITHLNDTHRWTRERIADWVETLEVAAVTTEPKTEVCAL